MKAVHTLVLKKPPSFVMVGGLGFEPRKAGPADLQSAPFDRFGNHPCMWQENT